MKNFKKNIAVLTIALFSSLSLLAIDGEPKTTKEIIKDKIVTLLSNDIYSELNKEEILKISFVINKDDEIVLLKVNTSKKRLNKFVEKKLDYKKINLIEAEKGEIYDISIPLKKA